jgi:hypothetical protein
MFVPSRSSIAVVAVSSPFPAGIRRAKEMRFTPERIRTLRTPH